MHIITGDGNVNYVVTILPKKKLLPNNAADNLAAESSLLSDSGTAEEYVSKALGMRAQYSPTTNVPVSQFANYNLVEQQNFPAPVRVEGQNYDPTKNKEIDYRRIRPAKMVKMNEKHEADESNQNKNVYQPNVNRQTDKNTKLKSSGHVATQNYHIKKQNFDHQLPETKEEDLKKHVFTRITAPAIHIQKYEVLSQIDASVKKFMTEMLQKKKREEDSKRIGSFYSSGFDPIFITSTPKYKNERHKPHKLIVTTMSPMINSQESHIHVMHPTSAVKQMKFLNTNYDSISSNVDLTIKNSNIHQKPLDLSALDVGQSWSHSTSFDHSSALKTLQGFDQTNALSSPSHKPKIHFNQETYHEINSLPYKPDIPAYNIESSNPEHPIFNKYKFPEPSSHIKVSTGGSSTSVGATMSFGKENGLSESMLTSTESSPIQIINGIAVSNPYKVDINTIR